MAKKNTKRIAFILAAAICVFAAALALQACTDNETEPAPGDYLVETALDIPRPTGLPDYALTIEWMGTYLRNRPTAIVFHGATTDYSEKADLTLSESLYTDDVTSSYSKTVFDDLGRDLAAYWNRKGFNIGIFHYENFADDSFQNVASKVYSGARMSYRDVNGTSQALSGLSFNLTEAFVAEWLKTDSAELDGGSYDMMEIRFIGVGSGAILALSAADYLNELYEEGKIGSMYLANRIDMLNPYLSHTGVNTVVDYREQTTIGSQLSYASGLVTKLAAKGVVFDLVESRADYYEYDNTNYSDIQLTTSDGNVTVTFLDSGDSGLYLDIKENSAYLNLRETFSTETVYATAFGGNTTIAAENAVLDWYLYTVNGSDYTSVGRQGNSYPMLDGYNRTGVTSGTSVVKYGVSAWTPTVYLRAVRGVEYTQVRYASSTDSPYTLSDFQAENFQISGSAMDGVNKIAGYIYLTPDENNPYAELRRDRALSGITVTAVFTKTGERDFTVTAVTDETGYYEIDIGTEYVGYTGRVTVNVPANRYQLSAMTTTGSNNYTKVSSNGLTSTSGTSVTMYKSSDGRYFVGIYNGALLSI